MVRYWPLAVALVIVLFSGIAHGIWSDRWTDGNPAQEAAERLQRIPSACDEWQGTDVPPSATPRQRAEMPGWLQRRYVHQGTRQEILVVFLCGRPGPISVHTPDVCYPGAGYQIASKRQQPLTLANSQRETAPFWEGLFVKDTFPLKEELHVWWSWRAGDSWQIADKPRFAFARFPVLYKLYAIYRAAGVGTTATDPCPEFLRRFLPQVNEALFTGV